MVQWLFKKNEFHGSVVKPRENCTVRVSTASFKRKVADYIQNPIKKLCHCANQIILNKGNNILSYPIKYLLTEKGDTETWE